MKIKKFFVTMLSVAIAFMSLLSFSIGLKNDRTLKAYAYNHDTLYYFSDNATNLSFCQVAQTNGFVQYIYPIYYNDQAHFLQNYYSDYTNIEDAYIIFEIGEIEFEDDTYNTVFLDELSTIFQCWESNNCDIMFICGTDEIRFGSHNTFLDYANIHVNTDLFTQLVCNAFHQMKIDNGYDSRLQDCTIFINEELSTNIYQGYHSCPFIEKEVISRLRDVYATELSAGDSIYDILTDNNIKLVCSLGNGVYFDAVYGAYITETDIYNTFLDSQYLYAIGRTGNSVSEFNAWYAKMQQFSLDTLNPFKIYIYDGLSYGLTNYYSGTNVTIIERNLAGIFSIKVRFVTDQSLAIYDNYNGRCIVSHKAGIGSGYGYGYGYGYSYNIYEPVETDDPTALDYVEAWYCYMDEELYDLLFDYDDTWPSGLNAI